MDSDLRQLAMHVNTLYTASVRTLWEYWWRELDFLRLLLGTLHANDWIASRAFEARLASGLLLSYPRHFSLDHS